MTVSAVIVSRMNHDLGRVIAPILAHPDVVELIIVRGIEGVYERWDAVARATGDLIYTQDDDAVVDVAAVLSEYEENKVTCNMPAAHRADYQDGIALVGWGCVFDNPGQELVEYMEPFERYACALSLGSYQWRDEVFNRECDRVFTGLSRLKLIDVAVEHLPQAHGAERMGREERHGRDLAEIRRRIYAVRAAQ